MVAAPKASSQGLNPHAQEFRPISEVVGTALKNAVARQLFDVSRTDPSTEYMRQMRSTPHQFVPMISRQVAAAPDGTPPGLHLSSGLEPLKVAVAAPDAELGEGLDLLPGLEPLEASVMAPDAEFAKINGLLDLPPGLEPVKAAVAAPDAEFGESSGSEAKDAEKPEAKTPRTPTWSEILFKRDNDTSAACAKKFELSDAVQDIDDEEDVLEIVEDCAGDHEAGLHADAPVACGAPPPGLEQMDVDNALFDLRLQHAMLLRQNTELLLDRAMLLQQNTMQYCPEARNGFETSAPSAGEAEAEARFSDELSQDSCAARLCDDAAAAESSCDDCCLAVSRRSRLVSDASTSPTTSAPEQESSDDSTGSEAEPSDSCPGVDEAGAEETTDTEHPDDVSGDDDHESHETTCKQEPSSKEACTWAQRLFPRRIQARENVDHATNSRRTNVVQTPELYMGDSE